MPTTAEEVVVDLLARTDRLERQLANASNVVDRRLGAMESRGQQFAGKFSAALGAIGVGAVAAELAKLSDAYKSQEAQLKLATASFGSFNQAQADVQRIADATRSSLSATTSLYANFARASQETGRSQAEAATATETFSKALKIGGADAASAASATLQFGQALASGTLRGDEFNSIMEASPRLARLIAEALGVPIGQLRSMAEEGKITSDVLFKALNDRRYTDGIDAEFKQLPQTFGDAMVQLENAAQTTFAAFDRGGQFSDALVAFLGTGTDTMKGIETAAGNAGIEIRATFEGLRDAFSPMLEGARSVFGQIEQDANYTRDSIGNILRLVDKIQNADIAFDRGYARVGNALVRGGVLDPRFRTELPEYKDRAGAFLRRNDQSSALSRSRQRDREVAGILPATTARNAGDLINFMNGTGRFVPRRPTATSTSENKALEKHTARLADLQKLRATAEGATAKRLDQQISRENQVIANLRRGVGESAATAAVGRAGGGAGRSKLNPDVFTRENAAISDRLLRAQADQAQTAEQVAAAELERLDVARVRFVAETERDKRLTEDERRRLIAADALATAAEKALVVRDRDEAIQARVSAALERQASALEAANRNQQDELRSRLDLATSNAERRDVERRLLDLAHQQERADQQRLIDSSKRVLADANATPDQRADAQAVADRAGGRLRSLDVTQANERTALDQRYESPLDRYRRRVDRSPEQTREDVELLVVEELDQVRDGISDAISKRLGVKDPLISGLLDLLIERVVMRPLADALGNATGGIGGGGGGFLGFLGNVAGVLARSLGGGFGRASGGYVAPGQTVRVNEHRGGVELLRMGSQGGTVIPLGRASAETMARPVAMAIPNIAAAQAVARPAAPQVTVVAPQQFDLRGVMMTKDVLVQMDQRNRAYADQMGKAVYGQALKDAPAALAKFNRLQG